MLGPVYGKICMALAAADTVIGFHRIAEENYAGAVLDFILTGLMLYNAWKYRDF